jgi:hypothetical protein
VRGFSRETGNEVGPVQTSGRPDYHQREDFRVKLVINCVTRGRPQHLVETIARTMQHVVEPQTRLMVSIDEDDPDTIAAMKRFAGDHRIIPVVRPREDSLGEKFNRIRDYPGDVYMPLGDYTHIMTPAFDRKILEAASLFPDNIGAVYSHMANVSFPSIWCVTHGLVEKMGWMCPPYFPYWFVDHWIDDIVRLIGRISFVDFQIGFREKPGTQEFREIAFWTTLFDMLRLERRAQARAIIDSPDFLETEGRKEILRRHYPLIEYRSQWVNDSLRVRVPSVVSDGGERYNRLREKAVEMMHKAMPALAAEMEKAA